MNKRAMISQPMAGKTDEEIAEARDRAHAKLSEMGYEFVNTLTNGFECSVCGNRVEDLEHCCITGTFNCCPMCEREVVS